ncbi:hypothetical protein PVK64_19455 [Aliivibrio sp. S4TY2]|uniref:hypothetical protein n=1 Tax=unclassified Aliivibrio TaxID=2645654 RepID=UPI00237971D1|nr:MULTISPECIES: hypothetical protein [unclassified Aliivibrio]MDD9158344.1 hypothetical protein [Aliivibrio sp. S4TY2]MDD9162314.1 hypothetical protein [Aliivibrio sp. S4TY1]MDD9166351.1 hypothetical protein [Aliivibrio sp. S4MY2]MDD9170349.1 hypothetical protein [Aliivibrio sp. S4MY4]MDD9187400.1 hypothetical protein [Aliivibrio sp. S4MY3]
MKNTTVISKKVYMSVLDQQKETLEKKLESAQDNLNTLLKAISELEKEDFNEVKVTDENGSYTFSIIKE